MNKAELVAAMAERTGLTKKDCETALNAVLDTITEALKAGEKVQLVGFGYFEVRLRSARIGRNPKTNETVEIPASNVPVFKPGATLKEAVQ